MACRKIQKLKIFFTTLGWPGMQLILEREARFHQETDVNSFLSHAFKRPAIRAKQVIDSVDLIPDPVELKRQVKNEIGAPLKKYSI